MSAPADEASALTPEKERRALAVAGGTHALHDGYTDLIYVLLPLWQADFGLSYAALGLLRGAFAGTMAAFQIPAAALSSRLGVAPVLAAGTAMAGAGYLLAGVSTGFTMLVAALVLGGLGSSTQHPLASAMVARAYSGARSFRALGTYNFLGDIGKMALPALASLMLVVMPWRTALVLIGAFGLVAALAILIAAPRLPPEAASTETPVVGIKTGRSFGFPLLFAIGVIDSATRMAFLTFLPFVLLAKGASLPTIGLALTLVFAGGAAGKLVCAFIGARFGVIATVALTELVTTAGLLLLLPLDLTASLLLLPLIGVALNGTSSVLYGSVPLLVAPERRTKAFGLFYTGTIGSGALAPIFYGLLGDRIDVTAAVVIIALVCLATLPLAFMLRAALPEAAR